MRTGLTLFTILAILFLMGCSASALTGVATQESTPSATQIEITGKILMLGRSVMAGWFMHWGGQGETGDSVKKEGFTLKYGHMETPPNIVKSAKALMEQFGIGRGWVVFFKLCFEDFAAGSSEEVAQINARNKRYIEEIYQEVCIKRGAKLIIGNALPQVKEYTTSFLIQGHKDYNKWLTDFADSHRGEVFIFDLYGALTTQGGYLNPVYAASPTDSHLNSKAYKMLDTRFFPFLKAHFVVK